MDSVDVAALFSPLRMPKICAYLTTFLVCVGTIDAGSTFHMRATPQSTIM